MEIYRAAQNTGMISKKNIAFPEGNKQFTGDFVLIWMKQRLIWFNLPRDGTINGLSNIKETFAENLQLQMSVLHQSMNIVQVAMSASALILSADFAHVIEAGHVVDFQYIFE